MAVPLLRRRFTVEDYYRMAQAGILGEGDRVELLEGEIVEMTPIGSRHAACVGRLTRLLTSAVGNRAIVWVQNPIRLGPHSEPQPDVALLRPRADFYDQAHPGPDDVLLVIEVAETSAEPDRVIKLPLYARAGIPSAWLVDIREGRIDVHENPTPEGYRRIRQVHRGERLAFADFPDLELAVSEILRGS